MLRLHANRRSEGIHDDGRLRRKPQSLDVGQNRRRGLPDEWQRKLPSLKPHRRLFRGSNTAYFAFHSPFVLSSAKCLYQSSLQSTKLPPNAGGEEDFLAFLNKSCTSMPLFCDNNEESKLGLVGKTLIWVQCPQPGAKPLSGLLAATLCWTSRVDFTVT